jgi:carboxymethylenebutenolidase
MGDIVRFASAGGQSSGYLAVPAAGTGPGVVVIQEWWGLVPHIEQVVDRLAEAGFVAIAPDHYRGTKTTEPDEAGKLMKGLAVAAAAADIAGAAEYLLARDEVTGSSIGCMGFCMGGGLALLAPTAHPHITVTSAFYPAMPWPDYSPDWSLYTDKEALIHKAESDEESSGPRIAEYVEAIRASGGVATVYDYPGSQHAFFNDERPEVYHPDYAAEAWQRTLDFFARRLGS